MAKLTAGSRIFMLYMNDSNLPFVVRDGVVTSSTSTIFEVVEQISSNSSETATFTGVGFANYQDGYPSAGIINGLTWKSNNSLIYGLEDISISVQELRAFLQSGDIQGLFKHLYRGADTITGSSADDALLGFAGNDILIGRGGHDDMEGGVGNDTYHIDGMDTVHEREEEGTDRVVSSVSYQLPWNVEQLELTGRAALRGTGNGLSNLIIGNAAANLLDGGDRGDVMRGGDGNDVYVVDDFRDATVEDSAGGGIDTVLSHVSRVLAPHIENLTLFEDGWSANSSGTGNSLANRIIGNKLDNRLDGRAGADYLVGGDGNDVCYVDHVGDQVIEAVDEGIDTVKSLVSYLLPTHAEILTLAGTGSSAGTGNWQDNRIVGNGASNRLEGLGGADRLQGGAGWDSLFGGAGIDSLEGGAGADKFGFDAVLNRIGNVDKVLDFSSADDRIDLASSIFSQADVGQLRLAAYHEGTSALDAADRIIYDQITGSIFYDADGIGGVAQVLFAKVTPGLDLVAADFFVYSG